MNEFGILSEVILDDDFQEGGTTVEAGSGGVVAGQGQHGQGSNASGGIGLSGAGPGGRYHFGVAQDSSRSLLGKS